MQAGAQMSPPENCASRSIDDIVLSLSVLSFYGLLTSEGWITIGIDTVS